MFRPYFLLFGILLFSSCQTKKQNSPIVLKQDSVLTYGKDSFTTTQTNLKLSQLEIRILTDSAIYFGNTHAYNKVSRYYMQNLIGEDFLFPALIMANQYKDPEAYYDVYQILCTTIYDSNLERMDSITRSIGMYYLLKSYELGYRSSKYQVDEIFTEKGMKIPHSNDYLNFGLK